MYNYFISLIFYFLKFHILKSTEIENFKNVLSLTSAHTLNYLRNFFKFSIFMQQYINIFLSVNVFLNYHFMTWSADLLINFYLNNFFRLSMNTLYWWTIIKQYRNVNVETKIILSLPIDLPSAHHNTNIVSINLFVPVFHNFPLCHAPTYNYTHIYTCWYILLQNEILYAIFYKSSVSLNVIHFHFI